jgi:Predicted membrane protein
VRRLLEDQTARLAEVERRLAALEARIEEQTAPEVERAPLVAVAEEPEVARVEPMTEASPPPSPEPATPAAVEEPLVVGEGRQRRLTRAGEQEVERRLAEGQGDAEIAAALGVARNSVANRRRRRAERRG